MCFSPEFGTSLKIRISSIAYAFPEMPGVSANA
jgi:hypothetical protein